MCNASLGRYRHGMTILCYFWLINCPHIRIFVVKMKWEENHLLLRVPCPAHLLWNDILSAMCHVYGQDALVVLVFLGFPAHDLPFILCFSLLFFFFLFSFLLPLWHFICIGVLFLLDLSSFPLCFSSKFFVPPSLLLFFYGRLLFSLVGLPLSFFFLCSVVWLSWDCR